MKHPKQFPQVRAKHSLTAEVVAVTVDVVVEATVK